MRDDQPMLLARPCRGCSRRRAIGRRPASSGASPPPTGPIGSSGRIQWPRVKRRHRLDRIAERRHEGHFGDREAALLDQVKRQEGEHEIEAVIARAHGRCSSPTATSAPSSLRDRDGRFGSAVWPCRQRLTTRCHGTSQISVARPKTNEDRPPAKVGQDHSAGQRPDRRAERDAGRAPPHWRCRAARAGHAGR